MSVCCTPLHTLQQPTTVSLISGSIFLTRLVSFRLQGRAPGAVHAFLVNERIYNRHCAGHEATSDSPASECLSELIGALSVRFLLLCVERGTTPAHLPGCILQHELWSYTARCLSTASPVKPHPAVSLIQPTFTHLEEAGYSVVLLCRAGLN